MNKDQDYTYTEEGLKDTNTQSTRVELDEYQLTLPERIEVLVKALGTMILEPQYEMNEATFKKEHIGAIQLPILQGNNRDRALNVLVELIEQL